jgi:hypothetical protein
MRPAGLVAELGSLARYGHVFTKSKTRAFECTSSSLDESDRRRRISFSFSLEHWTSARSLVNSPSRSLSGSHSSLLCSLYPCGLAVSSTPCAVLVLDYGLWRLDGGRSSWSYFSQSRQCNHGLIIRCIKRGHRARGGAQALAIHALRVPGLPQLRDEVLKPLHAS